MFWSQCLTSSDLQPDPTKKLDYTSGPGYPFGTSGSCSGDKLHFSGTGRNYSILSGAAAAGRRSRWNEKKQNVTGGARESSNGRRSGDGRSGGRVRMEEVESSQWSRTGGE
ncbi:hypothetical protein CRG98_001000 [Punica granatum]|uniref:Uncharacterized protein n=1 Tax=Punica granatum TaxID=22663 RepID=A0A2I0LD70_PUNGR|nr:hypothetical protein CRG98_001000 [Punica granatum]